MSKRQSPLAKGWAEIWRIIGRNDLLTGPRVGGRKSASGLTYARGFLLSRKKELPPAVAAWSHRKVGDWHLYVDPRVPIDHARAGPDEVWLVGDAFHAGKAKFSKLAEWLVDGELLKKIDGMGGRFLLIHRSGQRIEIYNDAIGARSVFYGPDVVASHSDLAAEVIGTGLRDWIIPFVTSRGFIQRDVKYLPGLSSPYEDIDQLTPNCRLKLGSLRPERYWPRESLPSTNPDQALSCLVEHLKALREYFSVNKLSPIIGLSAGRDSRGVAAVLADLNPVLFTFVRSEGGVSDSSPDSRISAQLSKQLGISLEIIRLKAPPPLDDLMTPFAAAFRKNTGYVRGNNSAWVEHYAGQYEDRLFVRGFGGEVLRGFYPLLSSATPHALAKMYDVNAGSRASRDAFAYFIRQAAWEEVRFIGRPMETLFYWEHRMGIWGSSALLESDMAFRGVPGYNSRDLFEVFMGLPDEIDRRALFESAVKELNPVLQAISYNS